MLTIHILAGMLLLLGNIFVLCPTVCVIHIPDPNIFIIIKTQPLLLSGLLSSVKALQIRIRSRNASIEYSKFRCCFLLLFKKNFLFRGLMRQFLIINIAYLLLFL